MKCKVTLINSDGGEFFSNGEIEYADGGFVLLYKIGTDDGKIVLNGGELLQERRGSVALKMLFKEGKTTLCTLGEGETQGSFPVNTHKLTADIFDGGAEIFLVYSIAEDDLTLKITVKNVN